jgi:sugar/nucleoside kinase (ribokinase family)
MNKILGIGNALVDVIIKLNDDDLLNRFSLPKGSMQLVDEATALSIVASCAERDQSMASGGSAANTIHGLARLGVQTGFIGTVGQDEAGNFFQDDLVKAGITPFLSFSKTQTGRAISLVSPDSERTFATFLGAAVELGDQNLNDSFFKDYNILHLEGYLAPMQALMESAVKKAKHFNIKISIDLASYNVVAFCRDFLKQTITDYVDIVFANEDEAKAFTGLDNPMDALHEISKYCETAVVKTGMKGSLVQQGNKVYTIGITRANSIDTTGAGDLYAAGFLYGLIQEWPLEKCGETGALLAANVIEELGAKINNLRWQNIHNTLRTL